MQKTKNYRRTRFAADVIKEASAAFDREINATEADQVRLSLTVDVDGAEWQHDAENEFFSDYRRGNSSAVYSRIAKDAQLRLQVIYDWATIVTVQANERAKIEGSFEVFERHLSESQLPEPCEPPRPVVVFLGHGHSPLWRDLKDHLHEKHGYEVQAYEVGARAGHAVRDILAG